MTSGIHHITAIASDAQQTVHFYAKILGLRLVKKTVNQDDVGTYHLFFGDKRGHPGMDLTFFIFRPSMKGAGGNGMITTISLAVPENALSFWKKRFDTFGVSHESVTERLGRKRLVFYDQDTQRLELVGVGEKDLRESHNLWTTKDIGKDQVIRHFYAATLSVDSFSSIDSLIQSILGFRGTARDRTVQEFRVAGSRGAVLEVHEEPSAALGVSGAGTVHHIAFRAKDEKEQLLFREKIMQAGLYPTDVIDRFYFKSVYFRTPAGILFEIATDGPGFTADESENTLGSTLALPPFLEKYRRTIESRIPPVSSE